MKYLTCDCGWRLHIDPARTTQALTDQTLAHYDTHKEKP